jgi:hypothetical protein
MTLIQGARTSMMPTYKVWLAQVSQNQNIPIATEAGNPDRSGELAGMNFPIFFSGNCAIEPICSEFLADLYSFSPSDVYEQ